MAKITAVDGNVKVEDATVEETITPVEDVVVEPEETIDSDFSVDNTEESYDEDVMPLPSGEEDATPVYNGDVAQQSSETIGKKWNEYTTGTDLDDTDELMILDTSAKANKRTLLSKLSDYVLGKLADKVFKKLETQNKTILGALNELNSKQSKTISVSNVTDIQTLVNSATGGTNILFHLAGAGYTGSDLPNDAKYKYGSGIIFCRNSNSCKIVLFPEEVKPVWKMSNWTKWKDFANNIVD